MVGRRNGFVLAAVGLALAAAPAHASTPAFTPQAPLLETGWSPRAAVGDMNGDGRPDVVVASDAVSASAGIVSVLLAQPGGGFAPAVSHPAPGSTQAVQLADFDGDGRLDIAVDGMWDYAVLLAQADGTYSEAERGPSDGGLGVADFDGDGRAELARMVFPEPTLRIGREQEGAFVWTQLPTLTTPKRISVSDIDGDGLPDVLVTHDNGWDSSLFVNGPDGLAPATLSSSTAGPDLERDLDGDGDSDHVRLELLDRRVSVGRREGAHFDTETYWLDGRPLDGVLAADFTGDGRLDLALRTVRDDDRAWLTILPGTPASRFGEPIRLSLGTPIGESAFASGDFDADGRPDLVLSDGGPRSPLRIWRNIDVPEPIVIVDPPPGILDEPITVPHGPDTGPAPAPSTEPQPRPPTGATRAATVSRRLELRFSATVGRRSTRLRKLRLIRVPTGATVTVRCATGCSRTTLTKRRVKATTLSLQRFARTPLKPGTVLRITVTRTGGKRTTITLTVRAKRAPRVTTRG